RDQADAGGPEPGIVAQPRHLAPGAERALRALAEHPVDGRDIDADLLEQPAAHHRHDAPALIAFPLAGAARLAALEAAGRQVGMGAGRLRVLEPLEGGADPVAQLAEPGAGARLP